MLFHKLRRLARIAGVFVSQLARLLITRPRTRAQRAAWLTGFCRAGLAAIDISCTVEGPIPMSGAVISNHLSYLDILVHASIRPCVFVAAIETRKMPLIGWISMMAGTVYVIRGGGGSAEKAAQGMAKGFRDGLPVVFFPEGTTFVGDEPVMPFRSGLLAQALDADATVTPGYLRYHLAPEDIARGKSSRNDVAWGPQELIPHLWNLLGLHHVDVELRFSPTPIPFSAAARADRKVAAEEAREAVLAISRQFVAP